MHPANVRSAMLRHVLLILTVLLAPAAQPAWAQGYDHPLIEQTFRLLPTGDAEVEEIRTFRFEGAFSWATITRSMGGQYGGYDLDYKGVWDADTQRPLRHQVERNGNDITLRWFYQAQDTTKRFLITYRIRNAVQRYSDVAPILLEGRGRGPRPNRPRPHHHRAARSQPDAVQSLRPQQGLSR